MKIATLQQVAKICGVSRTAVHYAVEDGRCPAVVVKGKKRVDLHDVDVSQYIEDTKARKAEDEAKSTKPKTEPKTKPKTEPEPTPKPSPDLPIPFTPPPPPPLDLSDARPLINVGVSSRDVKMRKAVASADLEEVKAKIKSEEYFEKVGAVVDQETLRVKMGKFTDVLVTSLLYYPEEIADALWVRAKAAGDAAPKVIREVLADRLETIIENAKAAAREIVPEERDRRYIVIDGDTP